MRGAPHSEFAIPMQLGRPMPMSTSPGGAAAPATAGRGEVGGLRRSIDKFRGTDTPLCVVLSLRVFRLEICWSLSLGGWWPPNLARRSKQ